MIEASNGLSRRAILAMGSATSLLALAVPSLGGRSELLACEGDKPGSISSNHGHIALLSEAQLAGAAPLTVSIKGSSSHDHDVTLTAEDLAALKEGRTLTVRSSTGGGHAHDVTFNVLKDLAATVALNHGHVAVISASQLGGDGPVALSIQGNGTHDHLVELTPLEVRAVRAGWRIEKASTAAAGHDHLVTFN